MRWQRPRLDSIVLAIFKEFLRTVAAVTVEYKHSPYALLSQFRVPIKMIEPIHRTLVVAIASIANTD